MLLFQELPTEIQLNALSQCQSPCNISSDIDHLTQYIQRSKAKYYLENSELSLSLFCCQSKQQNLRLIYKLESVSRDDFKMTDLLKSQSLMPLVDKKNIRFESDNHLDLVFDENSCSIKIYIQLRLNETVLQESSLKLQATELAQSFVSKSTQSMNVELQLKKGQEEETFGYDFENKINYSLNISKIRISEAELVSLIERKQGEMIVRY